MKKGKTNKLKIQPRGKWLLIKQVAEQKNSESGLSIPDSAEQEQRAQGTVEAVGTEIKDIKTGDVIIYGAYAGEIVKMRINGKEEVYLLLHDDDVIAFVK